MITNRFFTTNNIDCLITSLIGNNVQELTNEMLIIHAKIRQIERQLLPLTLNHEINSDDDGKKGDHAQKNKKRKQCKEEQSSDKNCILCNNAQREYIMIPCGHLLYCTSCYNDFNRINYCMRCHKQVDSCVRLMY